MGIFNILKYPRFAGRVYNIWRNTHHNGNPGLIDQGRELYKLRRLNLLEPEEYRLYHLFKNDLSWEEKAQFLSLNQYYLMETNMNPRKDVGVMNKMVFNIFAKSLGLAVPELYGVFESKFGYTTDGKPLKSAADLKRFFNDHPDTAFMFKPIGSAKGIGITKCKADRDDKVEIYGEGQITIDEFYNRFRETSHSKNKYVPDTYAIEKVVTQHPFLNNYCDTSTQTVRVVTFIDSKGEIEILATLLKLAKKGSVVDNVAISNLGAGIDESGVLDFAISPQYNDIIKYEDHPDTGYPIKGQVIPYFKEAVELAKKAHTKVHHLRTLGWDIAISDEGPVIIEGNFGWDPITIQQVTRKGLIRGSFGVELRKMMVSR